jgi:hypothetical protein
MIREAFQGVLGSRFVLSRRHDQGIHGDKRETTHMSQERAGFIFQ